MLRKGTNFKDILLDVIENSQITIYKNMIVYAALQISLVDVFKQLNIVPDSILGFTTGEFIAAYCDGTLTLEQTVLCIHYLGSELETLFEEEKNKINNFNLRETMKKIRMFIDELCNRKLLLTFNILGTQFLLDLQEVVPQPKLFTKKYLLRGVCTPETFLNSLDDTATIDAHLKCVAENTLLLNVGDKNVSNHSITPTELTNGPTTLLKLIGE